MNVKQEIFDFIENETAVECILEIFFFFKKKSFFLLLKQRKMNSVERSSFVHSKEGNDAGTCLLKKDQLFTYFSI